MPPHRVSAHGSFRIDRRFKSIGRIALSSGTANKRRFEKLNSMLTELYEDGRLDLLRAIKDRRITLQQVYGAKRTGRLPYLASELVLLENLWEKVEEWLPRSAKAQSSRKRYEVSYRSLKRTAVLPKDASVASLREVNWTELRDSWQASPADWNRLRASVSRFLSVMLGDKYHPFRRDVMANFPVAKEPPGRVPDLPPELFWQIVEATPEHVQPAYVALAATGLRVSEYLALEDHHLRPHTRSVEVPGTKTAASSDVIRVGPEAWEWINRAVPPPLKYKWLYKHWKRACKKLGAPDLTLMDLRHFTGQMLTDAGRPEVSVQHQLRHTDPRTTRRYTRQKDRGENARTMDEILFPTPPPDQAEEA